MCNYPKSYDEMGKKAVKSAAKAHKRVKKIVDDIGI